MVISLSHPVAFAQFRDVGLVVSFRASRRKRTPRSPDVQETWVNLGRGEPAVADAEVSLLHDDVPAHPARLAFYAGMSGFASAEEWVDAIVDVHGDVATGHLYAIRRTAWRDRDLEQVVA